MSKRFTAMDVERQDFRRKLNGYDQEEVRLYLKTVSEEIERLTLQNDDLEGVVSQLREQGEDFRKRERALQETLVTAQSMASDIKERAEAEADLIVQQARLQAEQSLQNSKETIVRLEAEISHAKLEKDLFEKRLRCTIEEHLGLLDQRRKRPDDLDNVHVLKRRAGSDR